MQQYTSLLHSDVRRKRLSKIGPRKYRTASADACAAYLAIVRVHYSAISGLNGSKPCAEKRSGTRWAMPCPIMQSMRLCRVDEALREAAGKALTDRATRGARQVEEYYCRESTLHRAAHVRERIESGVTQSDIGRIAGRSVGTDKGESARSAKRTGLDIRYTYPAPLAHQGGNVGGVHRRVPGRNELGPDALMLAGTAAGIFIRKVAPVRHLCRLHAQAHEWARHGRHRG